MYNIRKLLANLSRHSASVIFAVAISLTESAFAVTPEELMGDYTLTGIDINYEGIFPPPLDESDFPTVSGYFSATTAALIFEHFGQDNVNNNVYDNVVGGAYQLSGNTATVARASGATLDVGISMPNKNTLVVTGVGRDSNNQPYNYAYRYSRDAVYFTQDALDDAVESATAGLFTQEELDTAVEDALANVKPRVIPIILSE
jgi:hypothetical protein